MSLKRLIILEGIGRLSQLADEALVAKFKASGDNRYFQEVFDRHWKRISRIASGILRNDAYAEDAVQSTFEHAFREIDSFDRRQDQGSLQAWLTRICKNICLDELRRRRTRVLLDPMIQSKAYTDAKGVSDQLMIREALEFLAGLDESYRVCCLLRIEGHSYAEIMSMTGYSFDEVKAFIRTARRNLVKKFARERT